MPGLILELKVFELAIAGNKKDCFTGDTRYLHTGWYIQSIASIFKLGYDNIQTYGFTTQILI